MILRIRSAADRYLWSSLARGRTMYLSDVSDDQNGYTVRRQPGRCREGMTEAEASADVPQGRSLATFE
jgi:hypothetical protein